MKEHLSSIRFVDFFDQTPKEQDDLKKDIAAHGNRVRILVHPYYNDPSTYWCAEDRPTLVRYEQALQRLYATDSPNALPLFIFEQRVSLAETRDKISSAYKGKRTKTVVLVRTQEELPEPMPLLSELNHWSYPDFFETQERHWREFRDRFAHLGVTEVIMNGQNMIFQYDKMFEKDPQYTSIRNQLTEIGIPKIKTFTPKQCVGMTASELAKLCRVTFGALSFPHNRLTLTTVNPKTIDPKTNIFRLFR